MKNLKKIFLYGCIIFLVTLLTSVPAFCADKNGYVAFGDSIAAGASLDAPSEAYPSLLAQDLGLNLLNLAENGETSTELKEKIEELSKKEKQAVSEAALITISIGGNDLIGEENRRTVLTEALISVLSGDYTMSEELEEIYRTLKENLISIISMLRELNPDAVIFLQTLYNPYLTDGYTYLGYNIGDELDYYVQKINETSTQLLEEAGGFILIDTASGMNGVPEYFYTTFDFHPTAAGHTAIARILEGAYRDAITPDDSKPSESTQTTESYDTLETTTDRQISSSGIGEDIASGEPEKPDTGGTAPKESADATDSVSISAPQTGETIDAAAQPESSAAESPDYSGVVLAVTAAILFAAVLFLFIRGLKRGRQI